MSLFKNSPLFGVGFGNFMEYHFRTAHNSFVLCSAELGLIGLYPWLMLIFVSIRNTRFVEKELLAQGQRDQAMYTYSAEMALIMFVSGALLLSRTYHPSLFILFGMCAAITHVFVKNKQGQRYALIEKRDFMLGFVLTVVSVVGFYLFLRAVWGH
jgi:O-antigen ligase